MVIEASRARPNRVPARMPRRLRHRHRSCGVKVDAGQRRIEVVPCERAGAESE